MHKLNRIAVLVTFALPAAFSFSTIVWTSAAITTAATISSCGHAEEAGEKIDDAVEKAGDKIENATDKK